MNSTSESVFAILAACTLGSAALASDPAPDRRQAISRLDAAANEVRAELDPGPRMGALKRQELRSQLASISSERETLSGGGSVDPQLLASLTGGSEPIDRTSRSVISGRAEGDREVTERRLRRAGPRLGSMEAIKLREDLNALDALIHDLESGGEIDLARVDRVIGLMAMDVPRTPEQRQEELDMKRATYERRLNTKQGAAQRLQIRKAIDRLDDSSDRSSRNSGSS